MRPPPLSWCLLVKLRPPPPPCFTTYHSPPLRVDHLPPSLTVVSPFAICPPLVSLLCLSHLPPPFHLLLAHTCPPLTPTSYPFSLPPIISHHVYLLSPPPRQIFPHCAYHYSPSSASTSHSRATLPLCLYNSVPTSHRLRLSLLSSLCHVCPHGHPSTHLHIECANLPLPGHRPFTASCRFLQPSRQPPRLPANLTMNSQSRSRWQNAKASMSYRCRVDWGLPRSQ
jgi:hypothetical protein